MFDPESTIDRLPIIEKEVNESDKLNFLISYNGKTRRIELVQLKQIVGGGGGDGNYVTLESVNQPNGVAGLTEEGVLNSDILPYQLKVISVDSANNSVSVGINATTSGMFGTSAGYTARCGGNFSVTYGADSRTNSRSCSAFGAFTRANYEESSVFGYEAVDTAERQIQLGNTLTTVYTYGAVQDRSDSRDKTEITDSDLGLEFINALRPVKYKWDYRDDYAKALFPLPKHEDYQTEEEFDLANEKHRLEYTAFFSNPVKDGSKTRDRFHYGIIADELKETLDVLGIDFGGYQDHSVCGGADIRSVGYSELIAPMIKAIQELSKQVHDLKEELKK